MCCRHCKSHHISCLDAQCPVIVLRGVGTSNPRSAFPAVPQYWRLCHIFNRHCKQYLLQIFGHTHRGCAVRKAGHVRNLEPSGQSEHQVHRAYSKALQSQSSLSRIWKFFPFLSPTDRA